MNPFLLTIRPYRSLLIIVLFIGSLVECKCIRNLVKSETDSTRVSRSANVMLTQNLTDQQIKDAIRKGTNIPADSIKIKRCPCDPKLINIALPSDWQFEGQEGEVVVRTKGKGEGGGADVALGGLIAINRTVSPLDESQFLLANTAFRDSIRGDSLNTRYLKPVENVGGPEEQAIKIAVFDSGLNPNYVRNTSWEQSTTLCTTNSADQPAKSLRGWNFMNNPVTPLTADDQRIKHGSRVTYLLAQQFENQVSYRIIPMKVLGKDNTGDLFGILCAMETARQNKVHIFNMSLGYYGDRDTVFATYIEKAVRDGIWIVTAAGNQPDSVQNRDLSVKIPSFYPAYFSKDYDRVIAVTTINGGAVCDGQNFDQQFTLGVKDDEACRFRIVVPASGRPKPIGIFGTSYATPILAGWLGRTMKEKSLMGPEVKRQQFIDLMMASSPVVPGLFQGRFIQQK